MADETHGAKGQRMEPEDYLKLLDRAATYALTRGVPTFLGDHLHFLLDYVSAWMKSEPGHEVKVAQALLGESKLVARLLGSHRVVNLLQDDRIPRRRMVALLLVPRVIRLIALSVTLFVRSIASSAVHAFRSGIRSVPPLITAVVVVFVTRDAWQILGTGFTPRFFALVGVFLAGSMVCLVRRRYWADIDVTTVADAKVLLDGISKKHLENVDEFLSRDVAPIPLNRPAGIGAVLIYVSYLSLSLLALLVAAVFVALALVVVGMILFSVSSTTMMANSAQVFWTLPGHIVITRQLLSLSLSLGAFAAFFQVAAMHAEDRAEFLGKVLVRLRRALLVYTIYSMARARAQDLTGIPVECDADEASRTDEVPVPVPVPVPVVDAAAGAGATP